MHFHHHHHGGGGPSIGASPTLPPPTEGGEELVILVGSEVKMRREANRLQMWLEGPVEKPEEPEKPPAEEEKPAEEPVAAADVESEAPADSAPAEEAEAEPAQPEPEPEELVWDWREVSLVRLFPLTEENSWIAVITDKGKEVGILQNVSDLSPAVRAIVEEELRRRYMVPQIVRILGCKDRFDLCEWTVETDRGKVTFLTRHVREQVQRPIPTRLMLTDVEGNRYDVPDVEALDPVSRRMLDERT